MHRDGYHNALIPTRGQECPRCFASRLPPAAPAEAHTSSPAPRAGEAPSTDLCAERRTAEPARTLPPQEPLRKHAPPRPAAAQAHCEPQAGRPGHVTVRPRDLPVLPPPPPFYRWADRRLRSSRASGRVAGRLLRPVLCPWPGHQIKFFNSKTHFFPFFSLKAQLSLAGPGGGG